MFIASCLLCVVCRVFVCMYGMRVVDCGLFVGCVIALLFDVVCCVSFAYLVFVVGRCLVVVRCWSFFLLCGD